MEPRDVEAILEIQCTCPEIAQWTMWDYERVTRGEMPGWVENAVSAVPGVSGAKVTMVFDPAWDQSRMSDEARTVLNMW